MAIDSPNLNTINTLIDLGPTQSVQLLFAKLQLSMAEQAKGQAMDYMKGITDAQEESKKVAAMLQQARQLQADAAAGRNVPPGYKMATAMPSDMIRYMDANKLAYDKYGNDYIQNKDEWNVAIQSLQARQEQIGSDTQQKMVFIQDFMGQYNSYLQGANSSIQQSNQTLTSIARGQ